MKMYLKDQFFKGKTFGGIEIIPSEGNYSFIVTVIKRSGDFFKTTEYLKINDIEKLKSLPNIPYAVSISGKILNRELSGVIDQNPIKLILPNANENEFLSQKDHVSASLDHICIVRKDLIDSLLQLFSEAGKKVVRFSLGSVSVKVLGAVMPAGKYYAGTQLLTISKEGNVLIEKSDHSIPRLMARDLMITSDQIVSYTNALSLALIQNAPSIEHILIEENRTELQAKRIFELTGISILIFFFVLLQANSLVYQNLSDRQNEQAEIIKSTADLDARLEVLKTERDNKVSFFRSNGFLGSSLTSWYADEIGKSVPANIRLNSLEINPRIKSSKEKIEFDRNRIYISGKCSKSIFLDEWIQKLRNLNWARQVILKDYKLNLESGKGDFSLQIDF